MTFRGIFNKMWDKCVCLIMLSCGISKIKLGLLQGNCEILLICANYKM